MVDIFTSVPTEAEYKAWSVLPRILATSMTLIAAVIGDDGRSCSLDCCIGEEWEPVPLNLCRSGNWFPLPGVVVVVVVGNSRGSIPFSVICPSWSTSVGNSHAISSSLKRTGTPIIAAAILSMMYWHQNARFLISVSRLFSPKRAWHWCRPMLWHIETPRLLCRSAATYSPFRM